MSLKKFVLSSVLLAVGLLLHQVSPNFVFGLRPDFLLIMMFISLSFVEDFKYVFVIGLVSGVLTALTTTFPGGQLPNIIDKVITAPAVYMLMRVFNTKLNGKIGTIIIGFLGTLISGTIFLLSALYLVGLPASLGVLFPTVLVAAFLNSMCISFITKILNVTLKYSN
ncbi:tryptophan transporter [Clostridium malenominatum]|uniref:Tryptophan transporter n=1 Tax=Clostridium malenominatum TaxID=1539 RepID=A0ABN1IR69_9CLOT